MGSARDERFVNATAWVTLGTTACFLAAQGLLLAAYLMNGDEGISDNWVGYTSATTTIATLGVSLVALVVAIWAGMRGVRHRHAWLMRYEFPVLIVLVALSELFLFE